MAKSNTWLRKFGKWVGKHVDIDNVVDSLMGKYLDTGMTGREKETLDYEDRIADENSELAYKRQREFQEDYLTPEAQIKSQYAGYKSVGINPMALAGSQPSATGSNVPESSPSGGVSGGSGDLLGPLLSFELGKKRLDVDKALQSRELDIKEDYNTKLGQLVEQQTKAQQTQNQYLSDMLSGTVDKLHAEINNLRDELNNNRVRRNLGRANITAAEARAALDRQYAWLAAINSRIATADANTREQFNQLQNAYLYWSQEIAHANSDFSRRLASKQLSLMSHQIAFLAEQKFGVMVDYLQGYENWQQLKFVTAHQNTTYWNGLVSGDLKILGQTVGAVLGASKLGALGKIGQTTLALPNAGTFNPMSTPFGITMPPLRP